MRSRWSFLPVLLLAATLLLGRAEPADDKVSVLDAGTFITVEAREATLSQVLDRMQERLKITYFNTDRVDLTRVVSGRRSGSFHDIMSWLVPVGGFVILSEERRPGDPRPRRVEKIGFLAVGSSNPTAARPENSAPGKTPDANALSQGASTDAAMAVTPGRGSPTAGSPRSEGKPNVADSKLSEIKSVAEQLRVATLPLMQPDRQAQDPNWRGAQPAFLHPRSDVAQTSLEQQVQRSQALAVEQLRALMGAFNSACREGMTENALC